jgi:uncharacterized membrane protein
MDINTSGVVAGAVTDAAGTDHAAIWIDGQWVSPSTAAIGRSNLYGLNELGQVAGGFLASDGAVQAATWEQREITPLADDGAYGSIASGIDNGGQVTGWVQPTPDEQHIAVWIDGHLRDVGTLGGPFALGDAINDSGYVVGSSTTDPNEAWLAGPGTRACLWDGERLLDLNDLIAPQSEWVLAVANDINTSGQIVGWGAKNHQWAAFLLTPLAALAR